jgi:hypothetical protein
MMMMMTGGTTGANVKRRSTRIASKNPSLQAQKFFAYKPVLHIVWGFMFTCECFEDILEQCVSGKRYNPETGHDLFAVVNLYTQIQPDWSPTANQFAKMIDQGQDDLLMLCLKVNAKNPRQSLCIYRNRITVSMIELAIQSSNYFYLMLFTYFRPDLSIQIASEWYERVLAAQNTDVVLGQMTNLKEFDTYYAWYDDDPAAAVSMHSLHFGVPLPQALRLSPRYIQLCWYLHYIRVPLPESTQRFGYFLIQTQNLYLIELFYRKHHLFTDLHLTTIIETGNVSLIQLFHQWKFVFNNQHMYQALHYAASHDNELSVLNWLHQEYHLTLTESDFCTLPYVGCPLLAYGHDVLHIEFGSTMFNKILAHEWIEPFKMMCRWGHEPTFCVFQRLRRRMSAKDLKEFWNSLEYVNIV